MDTCSCESTPKQYLCQKMMVSYFIYFFQFVTVCPFYFWEKASTLTMTPVGAGNSVKRWHISQQTVLRHNNLYPPSLLLGSLRDMPLRAHYEIWFWNIFSFPPSILKQFWPLFNPCTLWVNSLLLLKYIHIYFLVLHIFVPLLLIKKWLGDRKIFVLYLLHNHFCSSIITKNNNSGKKPVYVRWVSYKDSDYAVSKNITKFKQNYVIWIFKP